MRIVLGLAPSSLGQLDADLVSVHRQREQRAEPRAELPAEQRTGPPLAEPSAEVLTGQPRAEQQTELRGEGTGASETGAASNAPV